MVWETVVTHWHILFVLVLIVVMLTLFVTEALPIEVTSLGVLAVLGLVGFVTDFPFTPQEALSGFSNHATVTILMMFILSAAVLQSGMVDWLGDHLGVLMGRSTTRHVVVIALLVGPVSAFINNTAAVAMMIPFVVHLANKIGESPSKLLIPLSFAAMLGGVTTLIGTSTNLLGSALRDEFGLGTFGMFEFTQAGAIVYGVGIAYLALFGHRLVPARVEAVELDERYRLRGFLFEAEIPERSHLINKRVGSTELGREYDTQILVVHRGKKRLDPLAQPVYFQPGDRVLMRATRQDLQRMADRGVIDLVSHTGTLDLEKKNLWFRELLVTSSSASRGKRLGSLAYWELNKVHPVAILHKGRAQSSRLDERHLRTGDVVLVTGAKQDIEKVTGADAFYVLGGPEPPLRRPHKVPHVLLILVGVVGLAAMGVFPIVLTATAGAVLMVATGALRLSEMYDGIRWDVILLLAGIIPLGIALVTTGAAALIGEAIAQASMFLPPIVLLALFYIAVSVLTEIISNNASVVLMIPIGIEISSALGYNPLTFILAAMFAASTSFLSPIGYQTNLMVMGPGGYRYRDYFRIGAPLNAILAVVTPVVLNSYWPLV